MAIAKESDQHSIHKIFLPYDDLCNFCRDLSQNDAFFFDPLGDFLDRLQFCSTNNFLRNWQLIDDLISTISSFLRMPEFSNCTAFSG
jgi:hypothetical protein